MESTNNSQSNGGEADVEQSTKQAAKTPKLNKQLYVNSGLQALFADPPSSNGGATPTSGYFGQKEPNLAILHEKPEHRALILMKIRGAKNREIALATGYTESWLSQLFRQPWAVKTMAQLQTEAGVDAIHGILESEAIPTLMRQIELRDDPETPAAIVKSVCDSLLDRYLGKPAQTVKVEDNTKKVDAETVEAIDQEIEQLRTEQNRLLGAGN